MKLDIGDRIELKGIDQATVWNGRRGHVVGFDEHSLTGNPEAAVVQMDPSPNCPGCQGDYGKKFPPGGPCKHRFAFKYVRKLSILELIAEAAQ